MLILTELPDKLSNQLLFDDEAWQHAMVCDLNTASIFWNRAALICLPKVYTTEATAAFLYLLQKESKFLGLWKQEWGNRTPTINDFLQKLITWGRFTRMEGKAIPVEEFWKRYIATINGMLAEPGFEYQEEGSVKPFRNRLVKEEIEQVICFDEEWNEQNYFIETKAEWILYNWVTMA
ncbi:MAG: hypothetical protein EOO06_20085 [Chitinophagaceae bacterium]|nr:MAG: hypothetical protein EOO06_20085 [Chitinophagaceae bacterium]